MCRLERSTWPGHEGQHRLVMRVAKITNPVQLSIPGYNGWVPRPAEGELLMTRPPGPLSRLRPWSIDLNEEIYAPFQSLL